MKSTKEILNTYLDFMKEKGHALTPNVSLVPENDPSLLFVNSGMFPLVPYLSGEPHPQGKRIVNVQRCLRFDDIDEVGDYNHTVAFHMIGNWSLGDYFKEEQLPWIYEFFIEKMGLDPNKIFASVFVGDKDAPKDTKSVKILQEIFSRYGIDAKLGERIFEYGKEDNWWKRGDAVGELGGPDSEIFYFVGEGSPEGKNPAEYDTDFLEIGNSVFMQYKKAEKGWDELSQKNVDFGGGLERIALVIQGKKDIFETDSFWPIINEIQNISKKKYGTDEETTRSMRILADHMRAATLLAMDGVTPSNKDQGYILRRLIRRMVRAGKKLEIPESIDISKSLVGSVVDTLSWIYPQLVEKQISIEILFSTEEAKFRRVLTAGAREAEKRLSTLDTNIHPNEAAEIGFDLYQSNGYPIEMFMEDIKDLGYNTDEKNAEDIFNAKLKEHQQKSRAGAEQKFQGGLADHSEEVVKFHTTTHLLHWALREVLGEKVQQKGSNITAERLRFDFSYPQKLTEEQIAEVENLVNQKAGEDVPVNFEILPKEEAEKTGALSFFGEKYGDEVKVYYIGDSLENSFSKEFCGGPHIENLNMLNKIEIFKQKSIGKGILRVYVRWTS